MAGGSRNRVLALAAREPGGHHPEPAVADAPARTGHQTHRLRGGHRGSGRGEKSGRRIRALSPARLTCRREDRQRQADARHGGEVREQPPLWRRQAVGGPLRQYVPQRHLRRRGQALQVLVLPVHHRREDHPHAGREAQSRLDGLHERQAQSPRRGSPLRHVQRRYSLAEARARYHRVRRQQEEQHCRAWPIRRGSIQGCARSEPGTPLQGVLRLAGRLHATGSLFTGWPALGTRDSMPGNQDRERLPREHDLVAGAAEIHRHRQALRQISRGGKPEDRPDREPRRGEMDPVHAGHRGFSAATDARHGDLPRRPCLPRAARNDALPIAEIAPWRAPAYRACLESRLHHLASRLPGNAPGGAYRRERKKIRGHALRLGGDVPLDSGHPGPGDPDLLRRQRLVLF